LASAAVAVLFFGMSPVLVKSAHTSVWTFIFLRLWVSVPIWYALMIMRGGHASWAVMRRTLVPGALFVGSIVMGYSSFRHTSIANASLIPAMQPVVLMAIGVRFMGERRGRIEWLYSAVALAGVVAVVAGAGRTDGAHRSGDLMAFGNLAFFGGYYLVMKKMRTSGLAAFEFLFAVFLWASVLVTPLAVVAGADPASTDGRDWSMIMLMIVGPGLLGHGLTTWAQRYLDVSTTSLLGLGAPVVSMLGGWWIHHQGVRPVQIAGGAVVLAGLAGIVLQQGDFRGTRRGEVLEAPA
jgi:drug/metabolite transporter (DMT)-like permease